MCETPRKTPFPRLVSKDRDVEVWVSEKGGELYLCVAVWL